MKSLVRRHEFLAAMLCMYAVSIVIFLLAFPYLLLER
jgi:uncharacterized membrane protein YhaH (DUF805 family)